MFIFRMRHGKIMPPHHIHIMVIPRENEEEIHISELYF